MASLSEFLADEPTPLFEKLGSGADAPEAAPPEATPGVSEDDLR